MRTTRRLLFMAVCLIVTSGCERSDPPDAQTIIDRSIEAHGGERYERSIISFDFRGDRYTVERRNGAFRYERRIETEDGFQSHVLSNDSLFKKENDVWEPWADDRQRSNAESTLNSVVYFALLPFRLRDPAVRAHVIDTVTVRNEPYNVVEVAFHREGGGPDWQDRFAYWFHRDTYRMDYLAYRFYADGGGTRFRQAVNPRTVNGIRFQDYLNYTSEHVEDIAQYPRLLGTGDLELISRIEITNIDVRTVE